MYSIKDALISIGPYTDEALDMLQIPDHILPDLYRLTASFRSSRWVNILEGAEFGLSHERAAILATALLKDIKAAKYTPKVCSHLRSRILK